MENKIDSVEKIREIGNSLYINIRKDIATLLDLSKGDYVKISITQPLAGSDLYYTYKRLNLYSEAAEESSTYFHTAYDTVCFKAEELNRIRADAFRAFSRQRIKNLIKPGEVRRYILPKLRSFESILYFLKVSCLALRGY